MMLRSVAWGLVGCGCWALACAGCVLDDLSSSHGSTAATPDAGLPALCSAGAAPAPFCTAAAGTCPLLADDVIRCPGSGVLTTGLAPSEQVGLASGAGGRGLVVFATLGDYAASQGQQEYVELASFGSSGAATFTLDTFAPASYADTGGSSQAGLVVVDGVGGRPIILSTITGDLLAAVGPAASGGAFTTEKALAAPAGTSWTIAGAGVEPGGELDVLVQAASKSMIAHRDASGAWTSRSTPFLTGAVMAVDAKGTITMAGWAAAATSGMSALQVVVGSSAPVVLATVAASEVTSVLLTVGQSAGAPLPVVAFGTTLTLGVPDGKGGFTTVQPTLAVAKPYVDGCADSSSISLGNCSCAPSCTQTGDEVDSVSLVRDSQGDVYVAWLEVDANRQLPVTLNSTSIDGQMITCSCTPSASSVTDTSAAVGLQLDRLVMSPSPHTEHRGTIPLPASTLSLQAVDGNGTLQLLVSGNAAGATGSLRRVVLDASKLP